MKQPILLTSLLITCAGFALVLLFTTPRFETNDDIAMSMIAHGYGSIRTASPNLVYSNVLWGRIVQAVPHLPAAPGYSIASYTALFASAWASLYFLRRLGADLRLAVLALTIVYVRALLVPQFTLNAGLLTAAGVLGLHWYARGGRWSALLAALLLAFFGYLVRSKEFALVLLVALPVIPWRALLPRPVFWAGALLLAASIAGAAAVNTRAYQAPEWQPFLRLQAARLPYNDYGVGVALMERPDITQKYNISANDLALLVNWFFVDDHIANPDTLNAMAAELNGWDRLLDNITKRNTTWQVFMRWPEMPLVLVALVLFLFSFYRFPPLALAWAALAGGVLALTLMGRPGVGRVYYPVVAMLALLPLARFGPLGRRSGPQDLPVQRVLLAIVLAAAALWSLGRAVQEDRAIAARIALLERESQEIPRDEVVFSWGAWFATQLYYPVFSDVHARSRVMYQLGVNTRNPNSVAYYQERIGAGFIERLTSNGLFLIASPDLLALLRMYCAENLDGEFQLLGEARYTTLYLSAPRCEVRR